ncbi:ceramidase [Podospora didyma]|uniref:Ceramidase n=1 Tax=Podospora didyma TaxID=330526 RepID=A0AAE0P635_9PEZI|nr:ceramidase [Podospora didyma]
MSLVSALQVPYREARDGFWGDQTSTLNWCEEDYNISYYCAEVVNTFTNLVFIYLGLKGMHNVLKYSHATIFFFAYLGYIVVGLGSMAFHATLWYSMQLADELPMIYTVSIMCFATFGYGRSPTARFLLGAVLVGVAAFVTIYYLYAKDPVFHQLAHTVLLLTTVARAIYLTKYEVRPALEKRNSPAVANQRMDEITNLALSGTMMFFAGFVLWVLDNTFCHYLIIARKEIQLPWAVLLEGHGWWHILTGLAYQMILWQVWLNRCLDGGENDWMLQWTPWKSIPQVVPRPQQAGSWKKSQ